MQATTEHKPRAITGAVRASLGIHAKSDSAPPWIDPETGETSPPEQDRSGSRLERYALQSVARSILPDSRTSHCLRHRQAHRQGVDVLRSASHETCSYGGLQTCGSVWVCPVCAAKISERRRAEVQAGMDAWKAQGGFVLLLTLTHPHNRGDALADLLELEQTAVKRFFGSRAGRRLMASIGRKGHIKAWEVTQGRKRELNNGWHPHFHILLFVDRELSASELAEFEAQAFEVWAAVCVRAGLDAPSRRHGVRLDDGAEAAAYVAKMGLEDARTWGMDCEMTKGHMKRAKDGETPFDLLRSVLADPGDRQGRALFLEYSQAFRGKRQLVWSRGLRELLGLGAASTDEELSAAQDGDAELLGTLTPDQWRLVLRCDARGELLEVARHGWGAVECLLRSLGEMVEQVQGVRDG